jgi:RNA polymerase sigma-70 factor, ECF subfamily
MLNKLKSIGYGIGEKELLVVYIQRLEKCKLHALNQIKSVEIQEQEMLESLETGDEVAFEMIFKTYYQSLCNYACSFLSDRDEAEEVVQSTFLSVWEKRTALDIRTSFKSYLFTMVRNASLNKIKHEKIKQKHAAYETVSAASSYEGTAQQVLSGELEQKIYVALNALPEQCRLVFKLSRFEELKYAEIAAQLNISVKTVENQIGKALKIMREELKDYLPLVAMMFSSFL